MGVCTSKSEKKSQASKTPDLKIEPLKKQRTSQKNLNEETKNQKRPSSQDSRQHSPAHSQNSQRSLGIVVNEDQRQSVTSHPMKIGDKQLKLQTSRISKQNSSRSLKSPGSPSSLRGSIQQGVQFYSTNVSKKYSIVTQKEHQMNVSELFYVEQNLTFLESNKTGKRARLELLDKADEGSIKYIYWLKTNQLEHKNILKCLEVHQENNAYQIVYENFDGKPISKLFNSDDLNEIILANIAEQMLSVLVYLKSLKMIHGNLTIDSWEYRFISGEVAIKLIDVKPISAKKAQDIDMSYLISPEQMYKDEITAERDVWAVMMTIYILALGELPYKISPQLAHHLPGIKQIVMNHVFEVELDTQRFSEQCLDFLKSVIMEKPKRRRKIFQLEQDEWIVKNKYPDILIQERLLMNILNQKGTCQLQQAILEIMIQEFEQETAIQLQKMFIEFDSDMDTHLTKKEFTQLFEKYTTVENLEDKINKIYHDNGLKDDLIAQFTFISLAAPREQLLTKFNLELIFNLISNNKQEIRASNVTKYLNVYNDELEAQFNELAPEKKLNLAQFIKMMELVK